MAIQVQGTTVIDDSRNIVGAKGIAGPVGFNGLAKTAVVVLADNQLTLNNITNNVYYCKVTASTSLYITSPSTVVVPNTSETIEQVILCIDYIGGLISFATTNIVGNLPTFIQNNRYFLTLTRLNVSTSPSNNSKWFLSASNAYSITV